MPVPRADPAEVREGVPAVCAGDEEAIHGLLLQRRGRGAGVGEACGREA